MKTLITGSCIWIASLCAPAPAQCLADMLRGVPFAPGEGLGAAAAIDGERLVLGAPDAPGGGLVRVFARDALDGSWHQESVLVGSTAPPTVDFGRAVALSGDQLLVGDRRWENTSGFKRGRVFAFQRDPASGGWQQAQAFSGPIAGSINFGSALALEGDRAVIGAYGINNMPDDGHVWIYERDVATAQWGAVQELVPQGLDSLRWFGETVALDGFRAAVGQRLDNVLGTHAGAVAIFRRDPAGWIEEQVVRASDATSFDNFGSSVSLSLGGLAVGAPWADGGIGALGQAYVFHYGINGWTELQILPSTDLPNPGLLFSFGDTIALDGDRLAVGEPRWSFAGGGTPAGRVAFYRRGPAGLLFGPPVELDRGVPGLRADFYGNGLAMDGTRIVAGAPGDDLGVNIDVGTGWVFDDERADCDGDGVPDPCELASGTELDRNRDGLPDGCQQVGASLCTPAVPNSTGQPGVLLGLGSPQVVLNRLDFCGEGLPPAELGYLLSSSASGFLAMPGGSAGNLCLAPGPDLGRHVGQLQPTDAEGRVCVTVDLLNIPTAAGGGIALSPGDTWYFQYWYRDGLTSNFTSALMVPFE